MAMQIKRGVSGNAIVSLGSPQSQPIGDKLNWDMAYELPDDVAEDEDEQLELQQMGIGGKKESGVAVPGAPPAHGEEPQSGAPASSKRKADSEVVASAALKMQRGQPNVRIGATKPSKKCCRQCRGCQWWFAEDHMALGKDFCHNCKNKLDNIS